MRRGAEEANQPFRMRIRQRPKQQRIKHAEHRRIHADAERQREHRHGGEAGVLQQLAEGEAEGGHIWLNGLNELIHATEAERWASVASPNSFASMLRATPADAAWPTRS